jgi:hypothetical protein
MDSQVLAYLQVHQQPERLLLAAAVAAAPSSTLLRHPAVPAAAAAGTSAALQQAAQDQQQTQQQVAMLHPQVATAAAALDSNTAVLEAQRAAVAASANQAAAVAAAAAAMQQTMGLPPAYSAPTVPAGVAAARITPPLGLTTSLAPAGSMPVLATTAAHAAAVAAAAAAGAGYLPGLDGMALGTGGLDVATNAAVAAAAAVGAAPPGGLGGPPRVKKTAKRTGMPRCYSQKNIAGEHAAVAAVVLLCCRVCIRHEDLLGFHIQRTSVQMEQISPYQIQPCCHMSHMVCVRSCTGMT